MVLVSEPMRCAANKTCHWEQQAIMCTSPSQSKPSTVTSGTSKGGQTASSRWRVRPPTLRLEPQPCTPGTPVPCPAEATAVISKPGSRFFWCFSLCVLFPLGFMGRLSAHTVYQTVQGTKKTGPRSRAMGNVAKQREELPVGKGKKI